MNLFQSLKESARLEENYRTLARKGMGTETKNSARVGLELDFYEPKNGDKRFGKITKMSSKGYQVKDDKGKTYSFLFHDRKKAQSLLKGKSVSLRNQVEEVELDENIQKIVKMFPRDNNWKKLVMKHKRSIEDFRKGKDLKGSAESDLVNWAMNNGEIRSDDADEVDDFLQQILDENKTLQEVTDKEINAMRKVSKDMQKVLVSYQKIANMGDKELKNTKHNFEYKQVLQARDTILSMIGKLQTKQTIEKSMKREELEEAKLNVKKQEKLVDLFNKLMDVKHNGPEFKKIKKEIDKLQREWVESDGSKRRVKEGDKRKNVMDSYREMWEQGQKYAPKQELPEQDLHEIAVPRKEFEKIKKGNTVEVEYDSSIKKGHKVELIVKSITRSNKYNVDKINMVDKKNPRGKFTFYSRKGGDATLAMGDMATVLKSYKVSK